MSKSEPLHSWDVTPKEAVTIQREIASLVDTSTPVDAFSLVAGCDISYNRRSPNLYAAIVVVMVPELTVVEEVVVPLKVTFPYVPGLLSFREAPPILHAWEQLKSKPDVVMLDAQGVTHPRRLGLASHIGLWLDLPCVGCAKTRLVGEYDDPGPNAGDHSLLYVDREPLGVVLRSAKRANPVFVSPGHKIDRDSALKVVQVTLSGYRHPTPTRLAHIAANAGRAAGEAENE